MQALQQQRHCCGIGSSSSQNAASTPQLRLLSSPSSSSVPWRCPPALPAPLHQQQPSSRSQQQQCRSRGSPSDQEGSQAFRFKHKFNPQRLTGLPSDSWFGWPMQDGQKMTVAGEGARLDAKQALWKESSSSGSQQQQQPQQDAVKLRNPWAQHFRVTPVQMPVPVSLPGSGYRQVEMLQDYSTSWPSLKWVDGKLQFRKGFLEPFDDPKVVPFFFYRGLEQLTYSWSDRAFQALFTAVYAGVHLTLFSWFWQGSPALALAVGLNWGLGKLSLAKWGLLLFLAFTDRTWLYFLYLAGKAVDAVLARLFPPVREFFWALFTMWLLFVAVTPAYFYPLPFAPFAPGSMGAAEAIA